MTTFDHVKGETQSSRGRAKWMRVPADAFSNT